MIALEQRPLVYIAGPYTHPDPVANTHVMIKKGMELQDTGLVMCFVPHVSLFIHVIVPRPYEMWLDFDLALLKRCDAMLRVPGRSSGADAEEEYADDNHIPLFYDETLLLKWAESWLKEHAGV